MTPGKARPAAIVALNEKGAALARKIKATLGNAEVHGREARVASPDVGFAETTAHIASLFASGRDVIGICAAGILIRSIAPHLTDKHSEPAVIAVAEDGSAVVPLVGGHHGANAKARIIADALGIDAAITTAGDVVLGFALDEPPEGWTLANPDAVKGVTAALLSGEPVALEVEAGDAGWLDAGRFKGGNDAAFRVVVTDRAVEADERTLVLHPPVLALGIGLERNAPAGDLARFVDETVAAAGLSSASIAAIGTIDIKADEAALLSLSGERGWPLRFFNAAALEEQTPRLANPSDIVFAETGCHGVSEGAALALTGQGGSLIVPKVKSGRFTAAIARAKDVLSDAGPPRGRLDVVGTGPGDAAFRTRDAEEAMRNADEVVGYGLYLDLVGDLIEGKARHMSELGEEEARARRALELAAEGKRVALICSGDPGIYALATLVFELVERTDNRIWNGLDIRVHPGISAVQLAAARLGAPINHDFCLISLSDLLTPRTFIEKRLKAAAEGDFVIAFYNPQSKRRRTLLPLAREILLSHRPGDTPVAVARNLGRPDESVTVTPLADFDPEMVDMLSLVLIGNSETRSFERGGRQRVYTPRGYGKKMEQRKTGTES